MGSVEEAKKRHTMQLMGIEGVVGVGIGEMDGRPCITVLVREDSESVRKNVPSELEGHPTRITVVGDVSAG
jgi:hypothetical protein